MQALHFAVILLLVPFVRADSIDLSSPEMIADGSELFAKNCAVGYCHGSEGRPGRGPALRDRLWDTRELYRITAEGLPGTGMPGWKGVLEEAGVWAVTAYVLSPQARTRSSSWRRRKRRSERRCRTRRRAASCCSST